jgi:hypothetical protein
MLDMDFREGPFLGTPVSRGRKDLNPGGARQVFTPSVGVSFGSSGPVAPFLS